jgi:hypothetical protein
MWQKVGVAFAGALLVIGIVLLRASSAPASDPTARDQAVQASSAPVPASNAAPRRAQPTPMSAPLPEEIPAEPAMRGPSAPVWKVMATSHAKVSDEREELITALKTAPPCTDAWCSAGRDTVEAWVATVSRKVPALTASGVQCSAAGCWTRVAVNDVAKWHDVSNTLPSATMEKGWSGPSILGGPDFQTEHGTAIALWVVMPAGDANAPKGEDR